MTDKDLIESLMDHIHIPDVVMARRRIQKLLSEADLHQQALAAAREEGRRAGLEEAVRLCADAFAEHMTLVIFGEKGNAKSREGAVSMAERLLHAIRALIDKPGDAQMEGE